MTCINALRSLYLKRSATLTHGDVAYLSRWSHAVFASNACLSVDYAHSSATPTVSIAHTPIAPTAVNWTNTNTCGELLHTEMYKLDSEQPERFS